jgi:hypothetical protein
MISVPASPASRGTLLIFIAPVRPGLKGGKLEGLFPMSNNSQSRSDHCHENNLVPVRRFIVLPHTVREDFPSDRRIAAHGGQRKPAKCPLARIEAL